MAQHLLERFPSALSRGLDIDMPTDDIDAVLCRIVFQQLDLRGNRIALFFLVGRGHAGIKNRLAHRVASIVPPAPAEPACRISWFYQLIAPACALQREPDGGGQV